MIELRVLILESVCGVPGKINARLFPEGFAMLRTLVNEFREAGFDIIAPLNEKLKPLAKWLDADVLLARNGLDDALSHKPDAALVIAPERGSELERITVGLKRRGITVLGAREEAIRVCGNKWLTYLALRGKVPQPKTWRKPPQAKRFLVKPLDGVGCEGIKITTSACGAENVIFQEFLRGEHASCCLLMSNGKGMVLSVNKQEIVSQGSRFEYLGGEIPFKHELGEKCSEIALLAAEALDLHGYCGVDLVVREVPYFIELNPRVTTSFVALAQVSQTNLGELLVRALNDDAIPKPKLKGDSIMRIPTARTNIRINGRKLDELSEIPGIIAPPLAFDGRLEKGSPMLLAIGSGSSAKNAKRKLDGAIEEAIAYLGVDKNVITWS